MLNPRLDFTNGDFGKTWRKAGSASIWATLRINCLSVFALQRQYITQVVNAWAPTACWYFGNEKGHGTQYDVPCVQGWATIRLFQRTGKLEVALTYFIEASRSVTSCPDNETKTAIYSPTNAVQYDALDVFRHQQSCPQLRPQITPRFLL